MKTLLLDNYDSFTYNLYQYVGELGGNPHVHRNDAIRIDDIASAHYSHFIISPGPGNPYTPRDVGISNALIDLAIAHRIPLLGVCLGHQVLCAHFGATVDRAPELFHGKASRIRIEDPSSCLFEGLGTPIEAMRYHSLCALPESLPSELRVTCETEDGIVMGVEHDSLPLYGIQFHPESIGTEKGMQVLKNFLSLVHR